AGVGKVGEFGEQGLAVVSYGHAPVFQVGPAACQGGRHVERVESGVPRDPLGQPESLFLQGLWAAGREYPRNQGWGRPLCGAIGA
ncbi:hypothetical protein B5180_35825, partial [Streptomyces sp. BF-3]